MFLDDIPINYLGVLAGAIIYFIIGTLWYAPFLFGQQWGGRFSEKLDRESKENSPLSKGASYLGEFVIALIIAYVLSLFIQISQADEIVEAITVALWVWIGFIATTHFSAVLWDRKTVKHFLIHAGFMLVGFVAMSTVIMYVGL